MANAFIAEAEYLGYHRNYIFHLAKVKLSGNGFKHIERSLADFIRSFDNSVKNYKIIYRASTQCKILKNYQFPFELVISDKSSHIGELSERSAQFLSDNEEFPLFITINEIKAKDRRSAMVSADRLLEGVVDAYAFSAHSHNLHWHEQRLCVEEEQTSAVLKPPMSRMHCTIRQDGHIDSSRMKALIEIMSYEHFKPESTNVFHKAVDFHRAASEAITPENQLLDLWAALEGFLPPPGVASERVTHYVGAVVPVLNLSYAASLFEYMSRDLAGYNAEIGSMISSVPFGVSNVVKTAHLLLSAELSDERIRLKHLLDNNPIMLFKCKRLYEQFSTAPVIKNTIEEHGKKVKWHLQRIYQTRNSIMHNAEALPYLNTLIENLHGYVDILIGGVAQVAIHSYYSGTVDGAIRNLSAIEKSWLLYLASQQETAVSATNLVEMVFGLDNPLTGFPGMFPWGQLH